MTDRQLELGAGEELGAELDVVDALVVEEGEPSFPPTAVAAAVWDVLGERNLFGEADRIAARAASAGTRRQYAAIYRAFAHWLREQLDRPPVVGDLDADVIAAYGRYLATCGGRGGRPAAPPACRQISPVGGDHV